MNILITGITGFVGSNFTQSWKDNHTLYGIDIYQLPKEGVKKIYSWELLNELPRVDAIIHLAGKAHETKNESLAQEYFEVNTGLTQKIFDYPMSSQSQAYFYNVH